MKSENNTYLLKNYIDDQEYSTLYKILANSKKSKNIILKHIYILLDFLNVYNIDYDENIIENLIRILNKKINTDHDIFKLAYLYCLNCNLFDIKNRKIEINSNGKLFLISDDISNTTEMIKYYWNNFKDISSYFDVKTSEFNTDKSKRYLACLMLQIDLIIEKTNNIEKKYKNIDPSYKINSYLYNKIINDKLINFLIFKIYSNTGLLNITYDNSNTKIEITEAGRKVFEYYSYNMLEEYKMMIDESWEYYDKGNFEQAYDLAKSIIKVIGNIPEVYNLIGCIKIKEKQYDTAKDTFLFALDLCEQSIVKEGNSRENITDTYIIIYYNLGLCYFYDGNYIKALHIFRCIKKTISYTIKSLDYITDLTKQKIIIK